MCGPEWFSVRFAPSQALPAGYEVGAEWGELRGGGVGVGCYYWTKRETMECGDPKRTRWEARRDAIEHAKGPAS